MSLPAPWVVVLDDVRAVECPQCHSKGRCVRPSGHAGEYHAARVARAAFGDDHLGDRGVLEALARLTREAEVAVIAAVRLVTPGADDVPPREQRGPVFEAALASLRGPPAPPPSAAVRPTVTLDSFQ